ncbi:MAG: hypothetical protein GYB66_08040 [Chloroflexi bacterium]|nr:hypothetical protein [Chloroflexota bacterium]
MRLESLITTSRKLLISAILTSILIPAVQPGAIVRAQDDPPPELPREFVLPTDVGNLRLNYPAGWVTNSDPSPFPYATISNLPLAGTTLPTALVELALIPVNNLDFSAANLEVPRAVAYFRGYKNTGIQAGTGAYGRVFAVPFGDGITTYDGAMMRLMEQRDNLPVASDTKISLGIAIDLTPETLLVIEFASTAQEADAMLPVWIAMVESLHWNDIEMTTGAVRGHYEDLENRAQLQAIYVEQHEPDPAYPAVDTATRYALVTAADTTITIPRPVGWLATAVSDRSLQFESPSFEKTRIAFRLIGQQEGATFTQPVPLIPGAILLNRIHQEPAPTLLDIHLFAWNQYPAGSVTYRLEEDRVAGWRVGFFLEDERVLVEIIVESPPGVWNEVRLVVFTVANGLVVDGVPLGGQTLLEVSNALRNPMATE